jgi:hypothetical protein
VRERSIREVRCDVIDDDAVAVPLVIPRQKGEAQLAIKDVIIAGRRYVLCHNEADANKDAEARAASYHTRIFTTLTDVIDHQGTARHPAHLPQDRHRHPKATCSSPSSPCSCARN